MNSLPVEQQACGISRKVLVEWLDKPARTATRAGTLRCRRHAYHRVTNPTLRLDDAKCEITKFAAPPGAAMPNKLILKQRGKDKPYRTAEQLKALGRVAQLTRIYRDQYPKGFPHNDLGVKYAKYMLRTLAFFETIRRRERWSDRYTPWMDADKRAAILNMSPHWYSAKSLAQHFELYDADRERLQAWTIAAVDVDKDQREAINVTKHRQALERNRRKNNIKPRGQYLESVKSPEPWKALKISKATYYRRGLHKGSETGSEIALSSSIYHGPSLTLLSVLPEAWPYCGRHIICRRDGVTVRTLQEMNGRKPTIPNPATSIPTKHREAA